MQTKFYFSFHKHDKAICVIIFLLHSFVVKAQETVTDYDGNVYKTITIGTQVWMKENLKTTHYRNGDAIPNVTDASAWTGLTAGAYCNYNNDSAKVATYGRLYNWYAVADNRNLCPAGWHVPSDNEWHILALLLDPNAILSTNESLIAGGKMKGTGTAYWLSPNTGADNTSGFTALPGGVRDDIGEFAGINGYGLWWGSTESSTNNARNRILNSNSSTVSRGNDFKISGLSVRCLKDASTGISKLNKENDFVTYPNPTTGIVNIEAENLSEISITDFSGRLLLKHSINFSKTVIDLSEYGKGMFMLRIKTGNGSSVSKVIIE